MAHQQLIYLFQMVILFQQKHVGCCGMVKHPSKKRLDSQATWDLTNRMLGGIHRKVRSSSVKKNRMEVVRIGIDDWICEVFRF